MNSIIIFLVFFTFLVLCKGDIPCNKVKKEHGYICVCNATYCDTISRPKRLPTGQFHVYYTSDNKPGFNYETGFFKMQALSPYGFEFEVNDSNTFQTVRGFGGAFTDSFGMVFNSLSYGAQENLLNSLFTEDGIEYTVCRVVLGSSDFSRRTYTYAPEYDPSLNSFNLTEDDYLFKISLMKRALNKSKKKIYLYGTTWSTPIWMKINNSTENGYIQPKFRQTWADYHVKALDEFRKEGIEFWALTTGNEPISLFTVKVGIATRVMFPEETREWIVNNLGPALVKANHSAKIITLDDMRSYAVWWSKVILRDPRARDYVIGVGLHWYADRLKNPVMFLDKLQKLYPDQEILYTESSINVFINQKKVVTTRSDEIINDLCLKKPVKVHPVLGLWKRAAVYAANIIENLNHYVTTYTDWNMALNTDGGPALTDFTCDASIIVNNSTDEFYKQPMHYVLGHFSKFVQPGSVVIDIYSNNENDLNEKSFEVKEDPTSTTPGFHFRTLPPPSQDIQFTGVKNPDKSYAVIIHNPKSINAEIRLHVPSRGYANLNLEPNCITSVIYW